MSQWEIPKPEPTMNEETAPFWEGTKAGELRYQECADCGHAQLPASPVCTKCWSPKLDWVASAGRGSVFSYTVIHHAFHPAFADETPYVVADVELDEGPMLTARIKQIEPERVAIAMRVSAVFEEMNDTYALAVFVPANTAGT